LGGVYRVIITGVEGVYSSGIQPGVRDDILGGT
jgi:hypothetical protein